MSPKPTDEDLEQRNKFLEASIEEINQIRRALQKSEEKFSEVFLKSPVPMAITTVREGRYVDINDAYAKFMGYPREELLGNTSVQLGFVTDERRHFFLNEYRRKGVIENLELQLCVKGGELRYGLFNTSKIIIGEEDYFLTQVADITERKKIEDQLLENEEKYRRITENMSDAVAEVDARGIVRYASPSHRRIVGVAPRDIIGISIFDGIHPEDRDRIKDEFQEGVRSNTDREVEYRYRHTDGHYVWLRSSSHAIYDLSGKLSGIIISSSDITKRRQAEETLRESEEVFTGLVNTLPDVIVRTDLEGKILFINEYAFQINGYRRDEIEGQNILQYLDPEDQSIAVENFALMMEGRSVPHEYHLITKDGRKIPFEMNGNILRNEAGMPFGAVVVCRNISERKQTEDVIRKSEERFRRITENMSDLVCEVDAQSIFKYASPSHLRILGYAPQELLGRPVYENVHPEDMERILNEGGQGVRGGEEREMEYRYRHKDGRYIWLRSIGHSIRNAAGEHTGAVINSSNITERRQAEESLRTSEERYRTIFESTATANIIVAEDATILKANNNFARLVGYTKEELEGKLSWTIFVVKEDLDMVKSNQKKRSIDPESAPASYELRAVNRKGEIRELFMSVAVIPETKESVVSLIDLTERNQLEKRFIQSQKMESVGRLAGGVAHDFNNMLSVIIGNTEMAMKQVKPSDAVHKPLQEILNAGTRSADLTRQLLAFARKQTVSPRVLNLNDTVASILKMLQRLIGEDIHLTWSPGIKLWRVRIDPSQVDQLLANLAVNARDAIEKTGRITIESFNETCDATFCKDRPECVPGDYVVLTVTDSGCGMSKETLASIFEPFFTTKKEGQGTGLGLATVYGIVKQNGGFISVQSEPGQGAAFSIYLPRYVDEDREDIDLEEEACVPGGTETILVVEDSMTVLQMCKTMLEILGYQVLVANGKDQAFKLVHEYEGKIDLLLTDVVMPDMNGKELSERIIAVKPNLKCLYMSGYTADVIARQGILEEGIKFIAKPFSMRDLAAKIRDVLG